jgi:phosphoglycerate dehydrogenase-like enzyme
VRSIVKLITRENDRLGFVGIGYMGRPIARRLLESGFKLTAYDRDHSKAEELVELAVIIWIRRRFMETPIMSAATQLAREESQSLTGMLMGSS